MRTQNHDLKTFLNHRNKLAKRRDALRAEADEIDRALGQQNGNGTHPSAPARSGPRKNSMSLREAVTKVTSKRALSKLEIIEAVKEQGYRFTTDEPINSLNSMLYSAVGKESFENKDGKFSPK